MKFLKKTVAVASVAVATFFVIGSPAMASPPPPVDVDTTNVSTVVVAAPIVTLVVSAVIPLLVGLLTRVTTAAWFKALLMIVLNAVSAFVTSSMLSDGTAAFSSEAFWTWLVGTIVSAVSYVVAYKPNGVTSNLGGKLATVGVK